MTLGLNLFRAALASGVAVAGYFAYRTGGGADAALPPPRRDATPAVSSAATKVEESAPKNPPAYQVALRLNELLDDARIEAPSLSAAKPFLQSHWRRIMGPWTHPVNEGSKLAMAVALMTSKMELQYAVPLGEGKAWVPDARVWNMNESSYDQRESIFAPTPATLTFKVQVPKDAKLEFSPAILQNVQATTVFAVSVVAANGQEEEVTTFRIQPGDAKKWFEVTADLAKYAGQSIDLRLRTTTDKPGGEEKHWAPPPPPREGEKPAHGQAQWGGQVPPMSLALWGNPKILAKQPTKLPYNVLWIVIDALRPDVIASFHDDEEDAKKQAAKYPPLDALLPKIPGLTPNIDALAKRGVRFTHAYSGAAWTRPGTISMLAGARSSEVGIDTYAWLLPPEQLKRYYLSEPPLLPLLLRPHGMVTRGVVNNFFMTGYAAVAIDFGFEGLVDHRYRQKDTDEIQQTSVEWLKANKDERFFLFCNFNSPHDPYEPPKEFRQRVPGPPHGPKDEPVRLYMGEAGKDDAAVGVLMKTLDELDLRKNTIVVVTADHGETLSQAHSGDSYLDGGGPVRYHHAIAIFEETTRVPILMSLPGVLDGDKAVKARVSNTDLAPTIMELEGLAQSPKFSGRSMMPLVRGDDKADRVVVSEGRAMRAIIDGNYRYIVREKDAVFIGGYGRVPEELFDLESDPGERHSLHKERPELALEMKAKLEAAMRGAVTAAPQASAAIDDKDKPTLHLRFAGAGKARKISGTITIGEFAPKRLGAATVDPIGVGKEAFKITGNTIELTLTTSSEGVVGLDLHVEPAGAPVTWRLLLDDKPWPQGLVFGGPFGLRAADAELGLTTEDARAEVYSPTIAEIDLDRDLGMFITRDRRGEGSGPITGGGEGAKEMDKLLQDWGYANKSGKKK